MPAFRNEKNDSGYDLGSGFAHMLLLILVVVLVAAGGWWMWSNTLPNVGVDENPTQQPTLVEIETKDWNTYHNNTFNFSFNYPGSLNAHELEFGMIVVTKKEIDTNTKDPAELSGPITILVDNTQTSVANLGDAKRKVEEEFSSENMSGEHEKITIGKTTAYKTTIESENSVYVTVLFEKNNYVYTILYIEEILSPEIDKETFDQILSTFEFVD